MSVGLFVTQGLGWGEKLQSLRQAGGSARQRLWLRFCSLEFWLISVPVERGWIKASSLIPAGQERDILFPKEKASSSTNGKWRKKIIIRVWYFSAGRGEWSTGTSQRKGTNATVRSVWVERRKESKERKGTETSHHTGLRVAHTHRHSYTDLMKKESKICDVVIVFISSNSNSRSRSGREDGEDRASESKHKAKKAKKKKKKGNETAAEPGI